MPVSILSLPAVVKKQYWGQLAGSSLSLALAERCLQHPGIKLVIAPDNLTATQLLADLNFFLPDNQDSILLFPDWETLPYDQFSPHQDIISERLTTLNQLKIATNAIVISSAPTLMHRLSSVDFLNHHSFILKQNQQLNLDNFRNNLQQSGYYVVNKVLEHGEYAVRGSIIDVFPMGSAVPIRIDLFDDTIDSLREFDPDTQRTTQKISDITILPAREFPLNDTSVALFRQNFRNQFVGNSSQCPVYESVSNFQYPNGIEYYLPLFFDQTNTFFDYIPDSAELYLIGDINREADRFWAEINDRYEQRRHDIIRPILKPDLPFINPTEFLTAINRFQQIRFSHETIDRKGVVTNFASASIPSVTIKRKDEQPLKALVNYLSNPDLSVLIIVESAGRREVLLDLLKQNKLFPKTLTHWQDYTSHPLGLNIIVGPLRQGAEIAGRYALIVESDLFGETGTPQRVRAQKTVDPDLIIRDLSELQLHAPVVHLQFGVGRYFGLITLDNAGVSNEFLILHYANNDKIYVPVTALHMISRYTGSDSDHAPLHKLGSEQWQKEKKKAVEKIHDVAIELLEIYAKREAKAGFRYQYNSDEFNQFTAQFPFTETHDQLRAINQIIEDMQSPRPMDRLICGDVGFGKTEVAMRAAFLAVQNSKQVCILVPTTLLAGQHYENFRDRFANFPVTVELLSRFRTTKDSTTIVDSIKNGRVDIIIGTHKLFSSSIKFKDLGLLIIDEEHRFGVKQKEHIKALRVDVDILSMTATPIPRTLNMAMAGIRDISLIATAPAKRLAIKTFWQEKSTSLMREAILREILRGGQVFFLHNNVQTIGRIAQELQELIPEAKIKLAHGQMPERELEKIMADFYHHHFNVLVCTTIIETGIDIPTANTIIIDRADKFGLAQLHQLRGRVGRSHHQAYAYLLTPNEKAMTRDAIKRLDALVSLEDLGAGFTLATHDMEIRGAGELLGEDQSGNMQAIGFNLYMEMLDRAVNDLKLGKTPELSAPSNNGPEIDLNLSAILPEDYISDIHSRLILYKRVSNATSNEQLRNLQMEMIDRFGLLPQPAKNLLAVTTLKLKATKLGIIKIQASKQKGRIEFGTNPQVNSLAIINLIQIHAARYKMEGPTRLAFSLVSEKSEDIISEIDDLLGKIS